MKIVILLCVILLGVDLSVLAQNPEINEETKTNPTVMPKPTTSTCSLLATPPNASIQSETNSTHDVLDTPCNASIQSETNPMHDVLATPHNASIQSETNSTDDDAPAPVPLEPPSGRRCECGVFKGTSITERDVPLISQSPMSVTCNYSGQDKCLLVCSALAAAAKDYGPHLLCASLGHYNNLQVSVHSRICGAKHWSYTGLSSPTGLCCHDHQIIDCSEVGNRLH